ncbi:MAG: M16 family metallopeptidase [Candidatus Bathyarchaeia archaeon]|jgi:predicted Zn-dependent peptidase
MHESLVWQRRLLQNGVRLLLYPKPSALTAQFSVAVQYGSNDDTDEQAGAAHFLEHMLAGGSPRRIDLSREVERLGGSADFSTNHEYTLCSADVMPSKLSAATRVSSELFSDLCFCEEQFNSEREIILHELAELEDDPREKVSEMLVECLFKTHPVRRPVGGYTKTVRQLSLDALSDVFRQRYVPQNLILILTGNFSEKDVAVAEEDFCCLPQFPASAKLTQDSEWGAPEKLAAKTKAGLSQTYLSIGARTTCMAHPDVPALDLLNVVLGAGASSRLFIELREKRGLTYDVGTSQVEGSDFGYLCINCAVKQSRVDDAQRLIRVELSRLRNENVPEEELNKAKDMILGDIFRGVDNAQSCPEILTLMEIQFGDEHALLDYVNQVRVVTAIEVRDVANKYLQEDQLATAVLTSKN